MLCLSLGPRRFDSLLIIRSKIEEEKFDQLYLCVCVCVPRVIDSVGVVKGKVFRRTNKKKEIT